MSGIVRRLAIFPALLLAAGVFALATDSWADPAPTAVTLIGPTSLTEHLRLTNDRNYTITFTLNIENTTSAAINYDPSGHNGFNLRVISDRNYLAPVTPPTITPTDSAVSLPALNVMPVQVTLTVDDQDTTLLEVVLTVAQPAGILPSTEAITLTRSPENSDFGWILGGSLIVGLAIIVTFIACPRWPEEKEPASKFIYTDSTFSFSQSWATSIGAVLTVVATVFTTTGVLADLVPGIDTGFFLAVNITYGVILAIAPVTYSAFQKVVNNHTYGTRIGFCFAATITGIAVGGQLTTVGAVVWLSDLGHDARVGLLVFIGVIAAVIVAYTEATRRQLWQLRDPDVHKEGEAPAPMPRSTMAALP